MPVGALQAAFLKRMLATGLAAEDTGLTMGLLCVLQRMLRCGAGALLPHCACHLLSLQGLPLHAALTELTRKVECCRQSRRLQGMLQHEAGGPSTQAYRPEADDPAEVRACSALGVSWCGLVDPALYTKCKACPCAAQAGALATPLWELSLLAQHYHPHVAAACGQLAAGSGQLLCSGSAAAFAASLCTATGAFHPPPWQTANNKRNSVYNQPGV